MSTRGYGVGAALGLGRENPYGTGVAPSVWLPFTQESLKGSRAVVDPGTITGNRAMAKRLAGIRTAAGDFTMEVDGANIGLPLHLLNGKESGALTSAALAGYVTSGPTVGVNSGGSLAVGAYRAKIATVWQRTLDSQLFVAPASAATTATTTSGNQTLGYSWTNPTVFPDGFTQAGTAIYLSEVGGGAGSEKFLAYVSGTGTTYSATGAVAITTTVVPLVATAYTHVFEEAFVIGQNPLEGFSVTVAKDNDVSERYVGCRMNTMELTIGEGNTPVMAKFGLMARDFESVANPTPSVSDIQKFMSHQTVVALDEGTLSEVIESLTVNFSNNCEMIPGLSGLPRMRDVGYQRRAIGGQFGRAFENHDLWAKMREAQRFSIRSWSSGGPLATPAVGSVHSFPTTPGGSTIVAPLSYMLGCELYGCTLSEAGANVGGFGRMVEANTFGCELDALEGTDARFTLINLTSTYAA